MNSIRIALAQLNPTTGDLSANADAIAHAADQALSSGAQFLICPTGALSGPNLGDLLSRFDFSQQLGEAVEQLATRLPEISIILHEPALSSSGTLAGSWVELTEGEVMELASYDEIDGILGTEIGTIALRQTEFLEIDPGFDLSAAEAGAIATIVVDNGVFDVEHERIRMSLLGTYQRINDVPVCYANLVGGNDSLVYDGGSCVLSRSGSLIARAADFAEGLLIVELFEDAHVVNRSEIHEALELPERVYTAVTTGLRDYVRKNGFSTVALGLSGGIDSALVAAIAADAIGGENIIGVSMPSRYSTDHSRSDADDTAERLGLDYRVQPIGPMFDAFEAEMDLDGVAEENLQARIRGMILMAISNSEGALVLATGNRTEVAVGYSTIYGDSVGGFAPLRDVPKTLVWEISRWRNQAASERGEVEPIPENSITKPPSAELRPGQQDTDSLPDYPILDAIVSALIDEDASVDALVADGFELETIERVISLIKGAEWKRGQMAIGPKVSTVTFGVDRTYPVVNRFAMRSTS